MNRHIIVGNLGSDPDLRRTTGGRAFCVLSVASNRDYTVTDKDGGTERRSDTQWHRVVIWGPAGESAAQHLKKGRTIVVEGRVESREWDEDGVKKYITETVAERTEWLGGGTSRREVADPTDEDARLGPQHEPSGRRRVPSNGRDDGPPHPADDPSF